MWRSWIPNGLSLGNLSCGFFSILIASNINITSIAQQQENYVIAGLFIIIAVLFDGLDGPAARILKVDGPLGEQLDSLADLTTFGIAPGYLMYRMYLSDITVQFSQFTFPLGMVIAVAYPVMAAYRLARFNVSHDTKSFIGLPSPIAGIFIGLLPFALQKYQINIGYAIALFLLLSILMVSNVKYAKPQVSMKAHFTILRISLFVMLAAVLTFTLGWYWVIVSAILLYVIMGMAAMLISLIQKFKVGHNQIKPK